MKRISTYITEKLHINNTTKIEYMYHPKTKDELIDCIKKKIKKEGFGTINEPLDLNDIDTGKITEMNNLFDTYITDTMLIKLSRIGNFDISDWDVSNVKNMGRMFYCSNFNGDLSNWNVSKVKNMEGMFYGSRFNGNLSKWNVSSVNTMENMFAFSYFNNNSISDWDVSKVENMHGIFDNTPLSKEST